MMKDSKYILTNKRKTSWNDLIKDFKQRHPNLAKHIIRWRPYDVMQILVYIDDGKTILFDGDLHRGWFHKE